MSESTFLPKRRMSRVGAFSRFVPFVLFLFVAPLVVPLCTPLSTPAFAGEVEVLTALSTRDGSHGLPSAEDLETLAGGEDELIAILLDCRTKETPPFAGVRAEKYLLSYADRSDVQDALAADLSSEQHMGLARIVSVHFDSVKDETARSRFARLLIERGRKEENFARYARSLRDSGDAEVSRLAKEAFPD